MCGLFPLTNIAGILVVVYLFVSFPPQFQDLQSLLFIFDATHLRKFFLVCVGVSVCVMINSCSVICEGFFFLMYKNAQPSSSPANLCYFQKK